MKIYKELEKHVLKMRSGIHRPTKPHSVKKDYKRAKEKRQFKNFLEEEFE